MAFVDDLMTPVLDHADERHLLGVRRLRSGEQIIAADGAGAWRHCVIDGGGLVAVSDIIIEPPSTPSITVAFAPVKGDRSEWAVAKLTELGIERIVALETSRAAVRWDDAAAAKALARWERVAREAAAQARRPRLPEISRCQTLDELDGDPTVAMAVPGGAPLSPLHTVVCIGPEGGWSDEERALDLSAVGLGDQVLRTETAAVSAGVILTALRGGTVAPVEHERGAQR